MCRAATAIGNPWQSGRVNFWRALAVAGVLGGAACGGGDDTTSDRTEQAGDESRSGSVVDPQPRGQAMVSVDGREFTLTEPGALDCTITEQAVTFSFRIGDNEVTLGAGSNRSDDLWFGTIDLRIANPDGEPGPIAYFPTFPDHSDGVAVDGGSFSYTGPMKKQPPNDGTNPLPVDVGDGLVTVTCP